ncbi:hypothetical protein IIA15_00235 [candidate division TA06 bacterium]|nr:hypothetical protein [candidate division TA06 bacterium]
MRTLEDRIKSNAELLKLAEIGQGVVDLVRDSGLLKAKKRKRVRADAPMDPVFDSQKGSKNAGSNKSVSISAGKKRAEAANKKKAGLGVVPDLPPAG